MDSAQFKKAAFFRVCLLSQNLIPLATLGERQTDLRRGLDGWLCRTS